MTVIKCQCGVINPTRTPECELPATQEDMLCDFCRRGHIPSEQPEYDAAVRLQDWKSKHEHI